MAIVTRPEGPGYLQGSNGVPGQERVAEDAPARHGGLARIDADHLYRHMIGAGVDISVELLDDGVQVAPEHEVVDETVAAAVDDVLVRVAQPAELRDVELAVQVNVQVLARDRKSTRLNSSH